MNMNMNMKNLLVSVLLMFGVSFGGSVEADGGGSFESGYEEIDGEFFYYTGWSDGFTKNQYSEIDGVDNNTFEILNYSYGKDKNHVYYEGKILDSVDSSTFEFLNNIYKKDKNNVYAADRGEIFILEGADSDTFQINSDSVYYAQDFKNIYYDGHKILNVDMATFEILKNDYYSKDKNHVYYNGVILEEVNSETFEVLNNNYTKDKFFVYYNNEKIEGVDPSSFVILKSDYIKDKNHIYYNNKKLENRDSETFEILDNFYTKDKNFVFYGEKIIEKADSLTFEILKNDHYSKDKNYIYYHEKVLKNADVNTFRLLEKSGYSYFYIDKNNIYDGFGRVIDIEEYCAGYQSDYLYVYSDVNSEYNSCIVFYVKFLKNKNLVKGYDDNTYRPENPITRAEFTKIILLAKYSQEEIDETKIQYFSDVKKSDWFANYVNFAKSKNIISGVAETVNFEPNENINFAEASKIIVNVLLGEQTELETSENWYNIYLKKLSANNINLENFDVNKNVTRGEMAELIYGLRTFVK